MATRSVVGAVLAVSLVASTFALPASARGTAWTRVALPPAAAIDPAIDQRAASLSVIVRGSDQSPTSAVRRAVTGLGGFVTADLPLVHGVAASLPGSAVSALATNPEVVSVTLNRYGRFSQLTYDEASTASSFAKTSGATTAWASGNLGEGVGVAVIDTGIASMNDLEGRIVHGPDLSGEGSTIDSFGHGTVMAGIIAGSGADSAGQDGGAHNGVAPKAHVVGIKVAGRNGVVDVSTILQAMHWVSAYKSEFNIRVLNLSWGTTSTQSPDVDPLNYAVQRLWSEGVVVVVAAGNSGPNAGTITKPGDDPIVLTVGAFNDNQNTDPSDDTLPAWSSKGPTAAGLAKPDLVASGRFIVSTRAYGSQIEIDNRKALRSPSYIRGSGSSQAAAVVSGSVALLLAARPELTPDQVKAMLMSTASPMGSRDPNSQGAGRIQLGNALAVSAPTNATQALTAGGLGSIHASRGGAVLQTDCGNDGTLDVISGEIDVRCEEWSGAKWTGAKWTGDSWTGAKWTGASWTGAKWTGASWTGASWTGASWTGSAWSGAKWTGASWTGASWTGASWTGASWTTAVYDEFLTAFWGNKTKSDKKLPGEPSEVHGSIGKGMA